MADKQNTVRTVVEIDVNEAQQEIVKLNAAASDSTKELEDRLAAKNKQVKIQNDLNDKTITDLEELLKLQQGVGASDKEIEKTQKKLNAARLKATRQTEANTKAQNKLKQAYKDSKDPIKQLDKATGGLIGKMQAFLANPIGVVITALVAGFQLLKTAINSTEDGAAKFNAITAALGQVFTNLVTILSDALQPILDWIIDALTKYLNPVFVALGGAVDVAVAGFKAWLDVLNLALTPLKAIIAAAQAAAQAIKGDFEGAKQTMKDFAESTKEAALEVVDSFVEIGETATEAFTETKKAFMEADDAATSLISSAAQIELAQNRLNKARREQQLLDAKLATQAKDALRDSKDFNNSLDERTAALERYVETQQERSANAKRILDEEIALLERRRDLGGNTQEDEEEYNQLLIRREQLNARLADQEREYINRKITLNAEAARLEKEDQKAREKALLEEEALRREIEQRDLEAQFEIDELDLERRRQKGEDVLELELELLERKKEQELSNAELLESERTAIIERYAQEEANIRKTAEDAKKASSDKYTQSAVGNMAAAFGVSQEVALAEMIMAAPQAIGQSFKKAAETYPFPLSLAMGAAGAAGTVLPIVKSISQIKKAKVKGAPAATGGGAPQASASAGGGGGAPASVSAVGDLSANNAARLGIDPSLTQNATQTASAAVQGRTAGEVVFSENSYNDFQNQVDFKEEKTTF